MFVTEIGTGPTSLVLHGFAGSGVEMVDLAERLPGTKLVFDLVGHGASPVPRNVDAYRMDAIVAGLVTELDARGLERIDIVGYSMGGRIALGMVALAPDRVRSAAVIGARAGIADPSERAERRRHDEQLADDIEAHGAAWFARRWLEQPVYETQRRLGAAHMASVHTARGAVDAIGVANSLRGCGAGAQPYLLDGLAVGDFPVAVLVGEFDQKFIAIARVIADRVPSAHLAVIPGSGHATHIEAPDATAAAIKAMWARVR